jgi:hypothetical protein
VSTENEIAAVIADLRRHWPTQVEISVAADLLESLQSLLAEKDETIAGLERDIAEREGMIEDRSAELQEATSEIAELRARCEAVERDAERLCQFERWADVGFCPHLVFDDDGHWAVSFAGSGPCAQSDEITSHAAIVEPHEWHDSVGEAIDYAIAAQPTQRKEEGK